MTLHFKGIFIQVLCKSYCQINSTKINMMNWKRKYLTFGRKKLQGIQIGKTRRLISTIWPNSIPFRTLHCLSSVMMNIVNSEKYIYLIIHPTLPIPLPSSPICQVILLDTRFSQRLVRSQWTDSNKKERLSASILTSICSGPCKATIPSTMKLAHNSSVAGNATTTFQV